MFAFMSVSFSFVLTYTIIYLPTFGMGCKLQIFETKKKSSLLLKTDANKSLGKKISVGSFAFNVDPIFCFEKFKTQKFDFLYSLSPFVPGKSL